MRGLFRIFAATLILGLPGLAQAQEPGAAPHPETGEKAAPAPQPNARQRIVLIGDSLAEGMGPSLAEALSDMPGIALERHAKAETGLVRSDFYDWNRALADILAQGPAGAGSRPRSHSLGRPDFLIGGADRILAVDALEAPDREMAAGDGLEMVREGGVQGGAAERADHRHGLGGELLRHHQTEARGDLGREADEHGRALLDQAALGNVTGGLRDGFRQRAADREVAALGEVVGV